MRCQVLDWPTAAPAIGAAFLASLVEVVEAFTIVLVVATLRGWKPAVLGSGAALVTLAAVAIALEPLLIRVPIHVLQLVIGVLLLLFGIGWLRKATLRAAGMSPMHDDDAIFAKQTSQDRIAGIAACKAVLLKGLGVEWPGHDLALFVFAALFLVAGMISARMVRKPALG